MDKSKKKKDNKSGATLQHKPPSSGQDLPDFISAPGHRSDRTDEVERFKQELEVQKQKMDELEERVIEERTIHERLLQRLQADALNSPESADMKVIFTGVLKQRDEILQIRDLVRRQMLVVQEVTDAKRLGRCPRCAVQSSAGRLSPTDGEQTLTTAVQCTDDVGACAFTQMIVLLNDGKTMNVDSGFNRSESDGASGDRFGRDDHSAMASMLGATNKHSDLYQPDGLQRQPAAEASIANDFGFNVNTEPQPSTSLMSICPICSKAEFRSIQELTIHVESHFADREMSEDVVPR